MMGTNQVIFTKGKEVVCYIYGYPDDSVYFDFSSLYNYYSISNKYADVLSMDSVKYIRLSSKGNHPFLLTQFDNLTDVIYDRSISKTSCECPKGKRQL